MINSTIKYCIFYIQRKKISRRSINFHLKNEFNAKKSFRQTVKPYTLKDGFLMHAEKQVLRKSEVDAALKMCRDNPVTGGHFGRDKTYQKIASRFYWKFDKGITTMCKYFMCM